MIHFITHILLYTLSFFSEAQNQMFNNQNQITMTTQNNNTFQLPSLAYSYDALEPYIDARTMQIHYEKHHAAYTANLNAAVQNTPLAQQSIEQILASVSNHSAAVRNNGGGYYNHNLFWSILTPASLSQAKETYEVIKAIHTEYGSFDEFKTQFSQAAATRFGSGWAWLSVDSNGKLFVSSTPNQDSPIMDVVEKQGTPVLALDVWEHAYYLHYQNRRVDYVSAFFNVINWEYVNELYVNAQK